jgi:hypothetical protein
MDRLTGRGWWNAARDVLLMVLSILIAFGLDAWWDGSQVRRNERAALLGLRAEFESNRDLLQSAMEAHEQVLASTKSLLGIIGPTAVSDTTLENDLNVLLGTHTFDPPTGTLDGLLNSGQLGLIQDDSLRTMLASWQSWIEDVAEDEIEAKRQLEDRITPFLGQRMPLRDIAVGVGLLEGVSASGFAGQYDDLLRTMEFESLLVGRAVLTQGVLDEQAALFERVNHLLDRLEVVLDT